MINSTVAASEISDSYSINKIGKSQNEHLNIVCQNLNSQYSVIVNLMPIS